MKFPTYDIALEFIRSNSGVDYSDSFDLAKLAGKLLRDHDTEKLGRDLVIRVKDAINSKRVEENTLDMWNELIVASGLYPYVTEDSLNSASLIRHEFHKSDNLKGVFFHEEQLAISMQLSQGKSVILSAPTSYGKSLLIEEIVASGKYKNIVIVQPTLALLDETRKKLAKYKERYKIIVSTSQDPSSRIGNIFLFTGERVIEYSKFSTIDFFVIDEFYKLSMERDDDRAIALNQALYKLLKYTKSFYMLGPSIKSIPAEIKEKLGITWERTDFATVAVDDYLINANGKRITEGEKRILLFDELLKTSEPTLIYVSSPARCTDLAIDFVKYLAANGKEGRQVNEDARQMCEWIQENIHRSWDLITALQHGVAFHHGALPRHLGSSIVDAFNNGSVRYLFCTATLVEGVNTSAKNVILFDKKKGTKPIDFFDYKNIAGRSGRMRKHFVGNVIRFEAEPPQFDFEVDIPILTQENAPLEILLAIDEHEIKPIVNNKLDGFRQLPAELQGAIKNHSTVNVQGQIELFKEIESNLSYYHTMLSWTNIPASFDHLAKVVELAWGFLAKDDEKGMHINGVGRLSPRWLASFSQGYSRFKSIGGLIADTVNSDFWIERIPDENIRINTAAFTILQISRTFFDYKLPKWLTVVQGIQEAVFRKHNLRPGNYTFIASGMENGFLDPTLSALREYDIPITAIRKLRALLKDSNSPEQNVALISRMNVETLKNMGLLDYEIKKLRDIN